MGNTSKTQEGSYGLWVLKNTMWFTLLLGLIAVILICVILWLTWPIMGGMRSATDQVLAQMQSGARIRGTFRGFQTSVFFAILRPQLKLVLAALGSVWFLVTAFTCAQFLILSLASWVLKDRSLCSVLPAETKASVFLRRFGLALVGVLGSSALVLILSSRMRALFSTADIGLLAGGVAFVGALASLIFLVVRIRRWVLSHRVTDAEIAEQLAQKYRQFKTWLTSLLAILLFWVWLHYWLPWLVEEFQGLWMAVASSFDAATSEARFSDLSQDARKALEAVLGNDHQDERQSLLLNLLFRLLRDDSRSLVQLLSRGERQAQQLFIQEDLDRITIQLSQFLAITLALVQVGGIILPYVSLGLGGKRLLIRALTALVPLPTLFVLDRMGITSSLPWLWVAVYWPFAVVDLWVSAKPAVKITVYFVSRGSVYHESTECHTLISSRVKGHAIRSADSVTLSKLGFVPCQRCRSSESTITQADSNED